MNRAKFRKILYLGHELHLRGYQRLRISPGISNCGCHWRCAITPITNILRCHGARVANWFGPVARYSSASDDHYFGWQDGASLTPSAMAERFIKSFPDIAAAGKGSDWLYAGWYVEMLHLTYPDALPIAYSDFDLPDDHLTADGEQLFSIPLPPPGEAEAPNTK